MSSHYFKITRPQITIDIDYTRELGRCYFATGYRIISQFKLSSLQIMKLRESGLLGSGQEFSVMSQCDGKENPTGYDLAHCYKKDTFGQDLGIDTSVPPMKSPYYVYDCEDRTDSGD